jgi:hypothetical protein
MSLPRLLMSNNYSSKGCSWICISVCSGLPLFTHNTQSQPGILTQLFPFRFSRQIAHENAVSSNDEFSWTALYVLSMVWNVDGGSIGGTGSLFPNQRASSLPHLERLTSGLRLTTDRPHTESHHCQPSPRTSTKPLAPLHSFLFPQSTSHRALSKA